MIDSPTFYPQHLIPNLVHGSFHLPHSAYRLRFLKSKFDGALPLPFDAAKGGTAGAPEGLNDRNREHPSQYIESLDECEYVVDVAGVEGADKTVRDADVDAQESGRGDAWYGRCKLDPSA